MDLMARIGEAVAVPFSESNKRLLINLYHEAFPLKEKLDIKCSSCAPLAYRKLLYFYETKNVKQMAKSQNKYQIKGGDKIVFPNLGRVLTNESLNDIVIANLKAKLGADFDKHFEPVKAEHKG